jgi:hypothetical protein
VQPITAVQSEYSLWWRKPETEILPDKSCLWHLPGGTRVVSGTARALAWQGLSAAFDCFQARVCVSLRHQHAIDRVPPLRYSSGTGAGRDIPWHRHAGANFLNTSAQRDLHIFTFAQREQHNAGPS